MLYDRLWEMAAGPDWQLLSDEYWVSAVGGVLIAAVIISRIRKQMKMSEARFSRIENQLSKMKNEIDAVLKIQVSLIMRLDAQSRARLTAAGEVGVGDAALTASPATAPAHPVPTSQRALLPAPSAPTRAVCQIKPAGPTIRRRS